MRQLARILVVGFGGLGLAGCGQDSHGPGGSSVSGLSGSQAGALNSQYSRFENAEDPPFTAETRFAAGQLAESQGSTRQAIDNYTAALKVDPGHLQALFRLGVIYAQQGDHENGIATWKTYVQRSKGDATGESNLGYCYELAGQGALAAEAYRAGIARDPQSVPCRVNYGLMLARDGNVAGASEQFRAVLSEPQVHYNLGAVYEQLGKREQARAEYQRAVELDPRFAEAQTRLAALALE